MNTTFPLSGKTFCLHFTKSTSPRETLPGKRENISPYEQNNIYLTCRNVSSGTEITSAHMNRPLIGFVLLNCQTLHWGIKQIMGFFVASLSQFKFTNYFGYLIKNRTSERCEPESPSRHIAILLKCWINMNLTFT